MSFRFLRKLISNKTADKPTLQAKINLANTALSQIGIGNYGDLNITGEAHLYRLLSSHFSDKKIIIFDIGANIGSFGQYAKELRNNFPNALIYAFEPNPTAYQVLCSATKTDPMQINEKMALGAIPGSSFHYSDVSSVNSELAGTNKKILKEIFKIEGDIQRYKVKVETIDSYCLSRNVRKIDFLKIDVEGSEYSVLKGAKKMLNTGKISYIQFEFNIHNIYNRIFIKDYYSLLSNYYFYRLAPTGLIPMGNYTTDYEVFRYQNILAARSELKP